MSAPDAIVVRRWEAPDESRSFAHGCFEVVHLGGAPFGRARYEPGWRWSKDVGPLVGASSCPVEHVGFVLSGRAMVRMDSGEERELRPGDLFFVAPGHDSWVVGDEPYVSLHLLGTDHYARK